MKRSKKASSLLVLLLILCMALTGCVTKIDDPIGEESLGAEGTGFSESEAAELFGAEYSSYAEMFDGPYLYYAGKLYPDSENDKKTVYRYNIDTGESEFACQDSVCTHDEGSGCPFENYYSFGQLTVLDGKVIYTTTNKKSDMTLHPLEWYDPKTREHGVLAENADNRTLVGDTLYFDRHESSVETMGSEVESVLTRQLLKYDWEQKKAVLVASTDDAADSTPYAVLYQGEERIVVVSHYSYDGKEDASKAYLYWIDPETGKRTPVLKEGLTGDTSGWFAGAYYFCENSTGDSSGSTAIYSYHLETGEKKKIGEPTGFNVSTMIPTDKYLLAVCIDPTGSAARVLRCYDYRTGQWEEKEYPLNGEQSGMFLRYYRGKLFFFMSIKNQTAEGGFPETGGYLQWDILTGEQTLIPNSSGLM